MKNGLKTFGKSLVTLTPFAIALGVNLFFSTILSIVCGISLGAELAATGEIATISMEEVEARLMEMVLANSLPATVAFQLVNFLIFGLWYKLWGRNKFVNPMKAVKVYNVGVAFLAAVALELLISVVMSIVAVYFPDVIQAFNELVEATGVAEFTVISFLATVILAPITEELVFRGVTLKLTKWAGLPFAIGNIIQAVLFGIFHMNLVQGVYATFIGLVLGYVCRRYKTLWVPILLHLFCNLYATVMGLFEIPDTLITNIVMAIVAVVCVTGAVLLMRKEDEKKAAQQSTVVATN